MAVPGPPFDPELDPALKIIQQMLFDREGSQLFNHEHILQARKGQIMPSPAEFMQVFPDISIEEKIIRGKGGDITLAILKSRSCTKERDCPALYHIHGGGMLIGNRLENIHLLFPFIQETGAVLVTVEYRLAPEHPAPAAIDDCYAGLQWLFSNANKFGIDPSKIVITGVSAGGNLATATALLNRDNKAPPLLAQMLLYPMLDDRNESVSCKQYFDHGTWTGRLNEIGWNHYLPGIRGTDKVRIYDAPARATDLTNLPQTWIEVGACEPFRDENVAYATKLWECGVQTELHVWPGAWHAFNAFAPGSHIAKLSDETRMKWLKRVLSISEA